MQYPSLAVLLATIGNASLRDMLLSLVNELEERDFLYIVIDGKEYEDKTKELIEDILPRFKCIVHVKVSDENLGYWGHGIRQQYQSTLEGDFILHADDDDIYIKGSFNEIRNDILKSSPDVMLIYKFWQNYSAQVSIPNSNTFMVGNIGTPCGVIPNIPNQFGIWELRHGGDFSFYNACKMSKQFIDRVIYVVKPRVFNYDCDYLI